jgi:hypothetical protein
MIKLTYGFCSSELARKIPGRIAPKLDQHAAHEQNRSGNPVCERGGAAVDFLVEFEDMTEVSQWIAENLTFDRMYIYGPDKPIHLSYSQSPNCQITVMSPTRIGNKLVPNTMNCVKYLQMLTSN